MNPNELGLLERLPVPTEAPFPDLGSCQGPERSLGLVICECVLKDICTYIREVPLLAGEGGTLLMTEVVVTAGATPCSLRAGPAQGRHTWPREVARTGHEPAHRSTAPAWAAPRPVSAASPLSPLLAGAGGPGRSCWLTVSLSSPDADRVDSTTLLGKAHLDFHPPLLFLPLFGRSHARPHVTRRGLC